MPTDAEIELKVEPARPEPYGQAGAQPANNMKMVRAIDRRMARLEHGGWDMAEVGDLVHDVLRRVRDDTEARADAGQRPQASAAPPQLTFEDSEITRIFSFQRRDVGLGPVWFGWAGSQYAVEPEPWPAGQTEGERLKAMQEAASLTPAQLLLIRTAEALTRHELVWLGWVSVCDPRFKHDELTTLGAAGFPINGMWRPAVPGPNASNRQRRAWLEATTSKRYAWKFLMAACMVWRTVFIARVRAMEGPMGLKDARTTSSPVTAWVFDQPPDVPTVFDRQAAWRNPRLACRRGFRTLRR